VLKSSNSRPLQYLLVAIVIDALADRENPIDEEKGETVKNECSMRQADLQVE
jgi:hypothetical protein